MIRRITEPLIGLCIFIIFGLSVVFSAVAMIGVLVIDATVERRRKPSQRRTIVWEDTA